MAGKKLSNDDFMKLLEEERRYQIETKEMEKRTSNRASGRIELIQSYGVTPQAFYYRKKVHLKGLKSREERRLNLGKVQ